MMLIELGLLAALLLTVAGCLLVLDRAQRQHAMLLEAVDRRHAELIAGFADRITAAHEAHRREVAELCQRIQAPEVAVMQHSADTAPDPSVVHAMSDAEAAELEERRRVIAEMERIENEALA